MKEVKELCCTECELENVDEVSLFKAKACIANYLNGIDDGKYDIAPLEEELDELLPRIGCTGADEVMWFVESKLKPISENPAEVFPVSVGMGLMRKDGTLYISNETECMVVCVEFASSISRLEKELNVLIQKLIREYSN